MPLTILFWGIYLFCIIFGVWGWYEPANPAWRQRVGGYFALWLLVGMLGWRIFGPAIR
jgi:hypothetical protein